MTCGTGGGHNAAARAIEEELLRRGHRPTVLNPYTLCGGRAERMIDRAYIGLVQRCPWLFGAVYQLGEAYRLLRVPSPVYYANRLAARDLLAFLEKNSFDVIVTTHLFPGEILTWLKNHGAVLPPVLFVATDYTCIPFTEELDCDGYVIPSGELAGEFARRGIPAERTYAYGIPVRSAFRREESRGEAKAALGLEEGTDYLLVSGGSMGAGNLPYIVKRLRALCANREKLIVICGSNDRLYDRLKRRYGDDILLLHSTDQMARYIRSSRIYFTKPGGLSSTEAAVMSAVLVHLPPIPGCETKNARFFASSGMSRCIPITALGVSQALRLAEDGEERENMRASQRRLIHPDAHERICDLMEKMAETGRGGEEETTNQLNAH